MVVARFGYRIIFFDSSFAVGLPFFFNENSRSMPVVILIPVKKTKNKLTGIAI